MPGPLSGIRIIEMAGLGAAPFCGMMLADHGAEVIRIERPGAAADPRDPLARSRRTIAIDCKQAAGAALVRRLAAKADGLIEGFRPGVMERLGLGPDVLRADNPRLVYGRLTGWGQHGPLAHAAGHDINYIALSGALHTVGVDGRPVPPANYVGDYAGGAMMLAFAMVSALLKVRMGGEGDVIDCAMTDGSALISATCWHLRHAGLGQDRPGENLLDGGAHFYGVYETADGKFVALGALEPQFYALLRVGLGVADDPDFDQPMDRARWPALKARVAAIIATRTRDAWAEALEGTDACFAPVLALGEAAAHPHNRTRGTFVEVSGFTQPAPAPRYGHALPAPRVSAMPREDGPALLAELGFTAADIAGLRDARVIG